MDSRPIGFWLKLVDRLIDEQFAATLEEHGVTRRQWQLPERARREPATVEQLDAAVAPFLSAATPEGGAESSAEHLSELHRERVGGRDGERLRAHRAGPHRIRPTRSRRRRAAQPDVRRTHARTIWRDRRIP